ncbi:pneumococcal-type histidine triad protein [Streptococcus catagoni]|uniref:pneumococcal-type histidine triad protein n=1 Tax=Streptococcus catagoni TaxID=2654874 RepID=UPI00140A3A9D|nr:pneumococcal-type histidine triad protein [Streptococcus catagoni]
MNNKKIIGAGAALVIAVSVCSYQLGQYQAKAKYDNSVSYVQNGKKGKVDQTNLTSEKSPDDISKEEGISAEQIVIKITDKGYVTSHGDHYHYYNGKVPYNALISEELIMKDPKYVFNKDDVINEVKDGHIIKVKGKYYLYLKKGSKRENVRTKAQIAEQAAKGSREAAARGSHGSRSGAGSASPQQLRAAKLEGRYTTDDGYIFSPSDVIEDTGDAFIVPHGDHFHYIPKSDLSASELAAAQAYWNNKSSGKVSRPDLAMGGHYYNPLGHLNPAVHYPIPIGDLNSAHYVIRPGHPNPGGKGTVAYRDLLKKLYALPKNQRHVESDGLVFDPDKVTRLTSFGYVVPHGDHWHVVPAEKLSALEIQLANMHLNGNKLLPGHYQPVAKKTSKKAKAHGEKHRPITPKDQRKGKPNSQIVYSPEEIREAKAKGHYTTSDGYIFDANDITGSTGDGYFTPHMDHEHWIPKNELSKEEQAQAEKVLAEKQKNKKSKSSKDNPLDKNKTKPIIDEKNMSNEELFEAVEPAKIVPLELIPSNAAYTVAVKDGRLIIPHLDHYHNFPLYWFDGKVHKAPDGYTLKQLFATIKYYMNHPEEVPHKSGWGHDSDHDKRGEADTGKNYNPNEEPSAESDDDDDHDLFSPKEEVDEYEQKMQKLASQYQMDKNTFQTRIIRIAIKYVVSVDQMSFGNPITFTAKDGKQVSYNVSTDQITEN